MAKTYRQPSKPTSKPCPKCKRLVLAGWDGTAAAFAVVIDAEILTRDGELVNIVNSIKMYATNTRGDILRRTSGEVLHHGNHLDMHREHDCEMKTPPVFVKPAPTKPPRVTNDEEVPF